ncbi:isoprenylcysteine carboxylmethyltransferase family protein [Candidatus Izemoplasma sp. B36]|uniref:methyltransferase family protein n=1 Tax=Candidatus Izemoplasma sp. B36 TaxID=3242468 RepID=UPI003556BBB7
MKFLPEFGIFWMNGFLFILPMLFIRLTLPKLMKRQTSNKLDYFPPVIGIERIALKAYFILNTTIVFSPLLFHVRFENTIIVLIFIICYSLGIIILTLSVITFSESNSITTKGIYKYSRNPMYIAYFLIYLAVALSVGSILFLVIVILYQVAVHFLILSEERWCKENFKEAYNTYCAKVNRYL